MDGGRDRCTDEELIAASRRDADAFAQLYRRYEAAMLGYFLRRTGDPEVAADLTAEVFAAALQACDRFRPGERPAAAWLFGIAQHKLVSSWRRAQVQDRARRKLRMQPIALDDEDLERIVETVERFDLEELLASLPDEQQAAVRSRVLDERGYDEIARELACSPSVVRQRVSRGLRSLRARLEQEPSP